MEDEVWIFEAAWSYTRAKRKNGGMEHIVHVVALLLMVGGSNHGF